MEYCPENAFFRVQKIRLASISTKIKRKPTGPKISACHKNNLSCTAVALHQSLGSSTNSFNSFASLLLIDNFCLIAQNTHTNFLTRQAKFLIVSGDCFATMESKDQKYESEVKLVGDFSKSPFWGEIRPSSAKTQTKVSQTTTKCETVPYFGPGIGESYGYVKDGKKSNLAPDFWKSKRMQ